MTASENSFADVRALTFDLFGTVLNLGGSLIPHLNTFLRSQGVNLTGEELWQSWRARQRIEQYQDNIVEMGHSGYQTVARRALVYVLQLHGLPASAAEVDPLMAAWQELNPFPEVVENLHRLKTRFQLVALSNGEPEFLAHLAANRIGWDFDKIISVQTVGAFKPHPGVYRKAAAILQLPVQHCLMVSANSFDVMGAKMCGFRGVFVNRYLLPYEDTDFTPDATVRDFHGLAETLLD